jgi:hypothetical protein
MGRRSLTPGRAVAGIACVDREVGQEKEPALEGLEVGVVRSEDYQEFVEVVTLRNRNSELFE